MTAVCIIATEFGGPNLNGRNSMLIQRNSLLFLHGNMQKGHVNCDLVNGNIDQVFLGNKRFISLDVF